MVMAQNQAFSRRLALKGDGARRQVAVTWSLVFTAHAEGACLSLVPGPDWLPFEGDFGFTSFVG